MQRKQHGPRTTSRLMLGPSEGRDTLPAAVGLRARQASESSRGPGGMAGCGSMSGAGSEEGQEKGEAPGSGCGRLDRYAQTRRVCAAGVG